MSWAIANFHLFTIDLYYVSCHQFKNLEISFPSKYVSHQYIDIGTVEAKCLKPFHKKEFFEFTNDNINFEESNGENCKSLRCQSKKKKTSLYIQSCFQGTYRETRLGMLPIP